MAKRLNKLNVATGSLIRRLRHERGWSQNKLATRIGVSYQQVQKYEAGKTSLTHKRLKSIAHIFGLSTPELVERIEK